MAPLKVLFVHGLESGPRGLKAEYLSKLSEVEVVTPDMHMSVFQCSKRNSVVRCLPLAWFLSPPPLLLGVGGIAALVYPLAHAQPLAQWRFLARVLGVLSCAGSFWLAARAAVHASLDRCVAVIQRGITEHCPDVVVGSSWGGAVALECAQRGLLGHAGLLLIAPAVSAAGLFGLIMPDRSHVCLRLELAARCLVVHGDGDKTVPIGGSRRLCKNNGLQFMEIAGGDHKLNEALIATGLLEGLVWRVSGRAVRA